MNQVKVYLPWFLRILLAALFIFSGISKTDPIWAFDKQLVDLGIANWCIAPFITRLIIALELTIAIALMQNHYIKRLVIPLTILLLVAFNIHLGIVMAEYGPMNGNCGCFGKWIKMTPLEAFIKNVLTIAVLAYLYKVLKDKPKGQNKFSYLLALFLAFALGMFMIFARNNKPCLEEKNRVIHRNATSLSADTPTTKQDSSRTLLKVDSSKVKSEKTNEDNNKTEDDLEPKIEAPVQETRNPNDEELDLNQEKTNAVEEGPAQKKSKFANYTSFNGNTVNLDRGKKIICLFAAGCDHCQETAKELTALNRKGILPPLYILFMDEETFKIPDFFKKAGSAYPYSVVDIPEFWQLLGDGALTPGVVYNWNGNIQKYYQGTEDGKFSASDLESLLIK